MKLLEIINQQFEHLYGEDSGKEFLTEGELIYYQGDCQILSQSAEVFEFLIVGDNESVEVSLEFSENVVLKKVNAEVIDWDRNTFAALLQLKEELKLLDSDEKLSHKQYTREGMIKRVMKERQVKALKADYRVIWADNIYGDHTLINERGVKYKIFLRDFEKEIGYSDCMDSRTNKLGTTKHLMYAFNALKSDSALMKKMSHKFPFVEVYLDPLNDYKLSWYYPTDLPLHVKLFITRYFGNNTYVNDGELDNFAEFISEAQSIREIVVRKDVPEKIEAYFDDAILKTVQESTVLDYSKINAELYFYQKEGVEFATFRKSAIIADEMGLGKTIQAISTAVFKRDIFGFSRALVVCPASLKSQWKSEIERFTNAKAEIIQGIPEEREKQYEESDAYFLILNYETVLRDQVAINKAGVDFLILDEAQRIKNYETQTANAIKRIDKKHTLVITGTPIENKLIDLYSIVGALDPYMLAPLWEFSYQHCLFDQEKQDKINGYYDLHKLKERISSILIRREKRKVLEQLPNVQHMDVFVGMTPMQRDYHASYSSAVSQIIHKKFMTPYDMNRLNMLLTSMRMVCDSTFLIDDETNESPKLDELTNILFEKIDIKNSDKKIIIFSEWVKMHKLIGQELRKNNVGFVELNGRIPVKNRGELIKKFEDNLNCKVFLSTEAGGAGLNLQVADTVINFELPWNPAKKNQRIGRIDRIGQQHKNLTVINLITNDSIETRIAAGLVVKQNLFDGVLNEDNNTSVVDFSEKGRSQFLKDIEKMVDSFDSVENIESEVVDDQEQVKNIEEDKMELVSETPDDVKDKASIESNETDIKQESNINEPVYSEIVEDDIVEEAVAQSTKTERAAKAKEMEDVMNQGLGFLAGLYKMSTGKDMEAEDQKIEINEETGEVTMKFKLPGF